MLANTSLIGAPSRSTLSRRTLLGAALAGAALAETGHPPVSARQYAAPLTWLLTSPSELRPPPPAEPSPVEIAELASVRQPGSRIAPADLRRWEPGGAVVPWTDFALELISVHKPSPVRASRALALLHVAAHDAMIAARDAQDAFRRPVPAAVEPWAASTAAVARRWSYPSEHAAVAAAAEVVLRYLFPDESPTVFAGLAQEAATSGLRAGTNFRGDITAGLAIGRVIGDRAVARGASDGSGERWDGSGRPTGAGYWEPTPPAYVQQPLDPLAGAWQPWVVEHGPDYRPIPPPIYGSAAWRAELTAVREAVGRRSQEQEDAVHFWAGGPGTATPAGLWTEMATTLIVRDALDALPAAKVLALTTVAMADAFICCWDAKYAFWTARPITADPTLDVLIPTPPFPSYPSGHATISAAAATVLGHLFPTDATALADHATEAKNSRLWAGIHFPIDNDAGALAGGAVSRLVVALAASAST